jgi:hypothetical protein
MAPKPPTTKNCDVPTDRSKVTRRSFLSGLAVLGTTALAGCGAQAKEYSIASETLPRDGTDLKAEEAVKMAAQGTNVEVPTNRKALVITVEIDSGQIAGVQAINGGTINNNPNAADIAIGHGSENGFKHVASIFFSHSSPGCLYYFAGAWRHGC